MVQTLDLDLLNDTNEAFEPKLMFRHVKHY